MHAEQAEVGHRWLRRRPELELFEFVSMFTRPRGELRRSSQVFDHERLNAELARAAGDERHRIALTVQDLAHDMAQSRSVYDGTHDYRAALRHVYDLDQLLDELGGPSCEDQHDWAWWLLDAVVALLVLRAQDDGVSDTEIEHAIDLLDYARDELDEMRAAALDQKCASRETAHDNDDD